MAVKLIVHTSPSRTTCLGGHPGPPRGRGGPTSHLPPQSPSRRVPPAIPHCCSASTQALALARRARPLRASACCCTPTLRRHVAHIAPAGQAMPGCTVSPGAPLAGHPAISDGSPLGRRRTTGHVIPLRLLQFHTPTQPPSVSSPRSCWWRFLASPPRALRSPRRS